MEVCVKNHSTVSSGGREWDLTTMRRRRLRKHSGASVTSGVLHPQKKRARLGEDGDDDDETAAVTTSVSSLDAVLEEKRAVVAQIARQRARHKLRALLSVLPHVWQPNAGAAYTVTWVRGNDRVDGYRTVDADIAWLAAETRLMSQLRRLPRGGAQAAALDAVGGATNTMMPDVIRAYRVPVASAEPAVEEEEEEDASARAPVTRYSRVAAEVPITAAVDKQPLGAVDS